MTMVQTSTEPSPSGNLYCPRCDAYLPPHATFCGSCGERVGKEKTELSPAQDAVDTLSRYQVISLVRQRPYVKLFLAMDNQQQRMVVIRNIDISSLDEEAQAKASELVQCEYDLLRKQRIASVMPVIDIQNSQGHLLTITSQPVLDNAGDRKGQGGGTDGRQVTSLRYGDPGLDGGAEGQKDTARGLRTLQDFMQNRVGAGLALAVPDQKTSLAWIMRLCQALEDLHRHQIVIGDLDPSGILLDGDDEQGQPLLTVCWLPPQLRQLFPRTSIGQDEQGGSKEQDVDKNQDRGTDGRQVTPLPPLLATPFSAPEVLLGRVEPASDVYSLGAILYFLLTGTPPDGLLQRTQQELLSPDVINSRVSRGVADSVMQALSLEPSERFQSVKELADALSNPHHAKTYSPGSFQKGNYTEGREQLADMDTISIMPLHVSKNEARPMWETPTTNLTIFPAPDKSLPTEKPKLVEGTLEAQPEVRDVAEEISGWRHGRMPDHVPIAPTNADTLARDDNERAEHSLIQQFAQHISGRLPAIPRLPKRLTGILSSAVQSQEEQQGPTRLLPIPSLSKQHSVTMDGSNVADETLLKHIQRLLVGERKQTMTAATIENPLRMQPEQSFNVRIRLMGRDEPDSGIFPRGQSSDLSRPHSRLYGTMEGIPSTGLGAHVHGDLVYVEVRSAIHENYAYIVQQAAVKIPAQGYVVEIVIPMQPFSRKSNGRRERLHVFFFDEVRRPLYERPFVLEILVSYLVQAGREGHHVLPIPQ